MSYNYSAPPTVNSTVSNLQNCEAGVSGSVNCWHHAPGTLANIYSGGGYTLGIDSNQHAWQFSTDYPAHNTWTELTSMGTVFQVAIQNQGTVYGLLTTTHCTNLFGVGYYELQKWEGSYWQTLPNDPCFTDVSISTQDASILGACNYLYLSKDGGNSFAQLSSLGTGWKYATSINSGTGIGVLASNDWIYVLDLGAEVSTSMAGGSTIYKPAADGEDIYAINSGLVYWWDSSNNVWHQLNGSGFTSIGGGDPLNVWAITSGNNNVYRYSAVAIQTKWTLSGSATCQGCTGVTHTGTIQVKFTGTTKHIGGTQQQCSTSSNGWPLDCWGIDTVYDPFDCFESGTCGIDEVAATVFCSFVGANIYEATVISYPITTAWAYVRAVIDDPKPLCGYSIHCGKKTGCTYGTTWQSACDNSNVDQSNVDYIATYVTDCETSSSGGQPSGLWGFDEKTACWYLSSKYGDGVTSPLICFPRIPILGPEPLPWTETALFNTPQAVGTKGKCTRGGVTQ